jgi:hypothetical protein
VVGDDHRRGRAERAKGRGDAHEPPETTTGADWATDGVTAGVAVEEPEPVESLLEPFWTSAGVGAVTVAVVVLAFVLAAVVTLFFECEEPAAIPKNAPVSAVATARAPAVNCRTRRVALSRATARVFWAFVISTGFPPGMRCELGLPVNFLRVSTFAP